jgi:hypothetical protein
MDVGVTTIGISWDVRYGLAELLGSDTDTEVLGG